MNRRITRRQFTQVGAAASFGLAASRATEVLGANERIRLGFPDTMEAVWEFPSGGLATFGQYEACKNPVLSRGAIEMRGTDGTLHIDNSGSFAIVPEIGGQFQEPGPRMEPLEEKEPDRQMDLHHTRNFPDCIKSRQRPTADIEIGHRSTTFCLLSNISLATRLRLDWDADREVITNNDEANQLLHYEYRASWKLEPERQAKITGVRLNAQ